MTLLSILDLARITQGSTVRTALDNARDLARHAEEWGYRRIWFAEHHNSIGIASSATSIVISHVAAGTQNIRVGSGGIMLPNHSPLIIAEQFGTLAHLYPGRIDLGLGRAPGTDRATMLAMRRNENASDTFPQDVRDLQHYLGEMEMDQRVRAIPGAGTNVPIWILGSSLFGARLAAEFGLPYAFASQFAPQELLPALETYRSHFKPSDQLEKPYAMVGLNAIAADTDYDAHHLWTTQQMSFTDLMRGNRGLSKPPIDDIESYWNPAEKFQAMQMLQRSIVGSQTTVHAGLQKLIDETKADELIMVSDVFDHCARLKSYQLISNFKGNDLTI